MPRIDYKIWYSSVTSTEDKILKPIIIVDGIDWNGNKNRDIDAIFDESLQVIGESYKFGEKLQEEGYDVIIVDFPIYQIGKRTLSGVIETNDQGYPIEFGTWEEKVTRKGGADYIQRNAQAVKEMIRYVNAKLVENESDEELVL